MNLFLCLDGGVGKILTVDDLRRRVYTAVDWCCVLK